MKKRTATISFLVMSSMMFGMTPALPFSGQSNANKGAKGEMQQGGKEAKNAGKSLGKNVKHGDVVKGGTEFGKHTGNSAKHVAKGAAKGTTTGAKKTANATESAAKTTGNAAKKTGNAAKKTGKTVKKAITPP